MPVSIPMPPLGACVPGRTLIYAVVCDPTGEGYGGGEWIDSAELAGRVAEVGNTSARIARIAGELKPHGCGCSGGGPASVIAATVEAVKAGFEMSLKAAAK